MKLNMKHIKTYLRKQSADLKKKIIHHKKYLSMKATLKTIEYHERRLAHLVSRFACNTRMIVDTSSSPPVSHAI